MENEELLTVRQVAQIFRVDETTVRRWIVHKSLDAVSLPHRNKRTMYRIRKSTVDAMLATAPEKDNYEQQI